jgi:competence protein ComEA
MFRKFLKDYFTFTRSERNGLIVLIILIFILISIRMIIPHIRQNKTYDFSEFQDEISEFEKSISEAEEYNLFLFDPNTATREELLNLGFEPGVVRNIMKYRDHGGVFRFREDLRKIYGLDSAEYLRIEPFIQISTSKVTAGEKSGDSTYMPPDALNNQNLTFKPLPLNVSDSAALAGIYGIGPILSVRIIKYRNLLGGYISKEQLLEVYGMTDVNFKNIRDAIYIDTAAVIPININTADFSVLSHHPYLNDYQARAIIAYREINGKFKNANEIEQNSLLPQDVYLKFKPYLTVE